MVDLQKEMAEMQASRDEQSNLNQTLHSQLRSSEVALNAKLEETAHSESSLREKLQDSCQSLHSAIFIFVTLGVFFFWQCEVACIRELLLG